MRDLRALVAQQDKRAEQQGQVPTASGAAPSAAHPTAAGGLDLYSVESHDWWLALLVSSLERFCIGSDLNTLRFTREQIKSLETVLAALAAGDPRMPLLVQLPSFSLLTTVMVVAAVGDIERLPSAEQASEAGS